jgi:F-type H+-transporting ATPase subunit delta
MRQYKVANRYAKALFTLALETNQLETVSKDIELISAIDHDEFKRVLMSPIISGDKKADLFRAVFGGRVSELTSKFFNLVFMKGRVTSLSEIREDFETQYRAYKKIKIVKLTTAVPISETLLEDLRKGVQQNTQYRDYTLEMETIVDDRIIGGFILQIGDDLYDASIRHDLDVIKKQFVENMYVQKIR